MHNRINHGKQNYLTVENPILELAYSNSLARPNLYEILRVCLTYSIHMLYQIKMIFWLLFFARKTF